MYAEADLLPLSGLQHLAFCERQWGLIHIEQSWEENLLTAEGRVLHDKVDEPHYETREGMRMVRALPLRCLRLGLSGRADLVEFPAVGSAGGPPVPVEFKRGRPKRVDADDVQLCAQALCLEEMMGGSIAVGFLYYHQTRHRHEVRLDRALRTRVERLADRMHELHARRLTPRAERAPKCTQCSLVDICQPDWLGAKKDPWRRWQALMKKGIEP
jgi:CRISPR-associated exonuclease Cas4